LFQVGGHGGKDNGGFDELGDGHVRGFRVPMDGTEFLGSAADDYTDVSVHGSGVHGIHTESRHAVEGVGLDRFGAPDCALPVPSRSIWTV